VPSRINRIVGIERGHHHLADLASRRGSPVPGRTISTITLSLTIMPIGACTRVRNLDLARFPES